MSVHNDIREVLAGKRRFVLVRGDCGRVLPGMPSESIDAVIVDPPAGIGFCGKAWDGSKGGRAPWVSEMSGLFGAHLRVLKEGHLGFVWSYPRTSHWTGQALEESGFEIVDCFFHLFSHRRPSSPSLPKMSCEMWWMVRRPGGSKVLPGIGACRIPVLERRGGGSKPSEGRHPTSVLLTHSEPEGEPCEPGCVVHTLDRLSGRLKSGTGARVGKSRAGYRGNTYGAHCRPEGTPCVCYGDEGGASRFFSVFHDDPPFLYCNRASRAERNMGLPDGMENEGVAVKPIALMRHLVKLATPAAHGIVLDGFAGTGSTGCACALEGVEFIGIEKNKGDLDVAKRRISQCTTTR